MPLIRVTKRSFTAGEFSPLTALRQDVQRFEHGALQLENWIVLLQGAVRRRPGLRFVHMVKSPAETTILRPFEPSTSEAYVMELGPGYIRFYRNNALLMSGGTPVEVATPYSASSLRELRFAQSNDVMIIVHPAYAPRRLSRTSPTTFVLSLITFRPPPTYEAGNVPESTIALSALTGAIAISASLPTFIAADVGRQITAGVGRASILSYINSQSITAQVRDDFTALTFAPGGWTMNGSPQGRCTPSASSPLTANCTLTLEAEQAGAAELLTNGDFASGDLTSWTNWSAPIVASGTHTGGTVAYLLDAGASFLSSGVRPTHLVSNTTDGSVGQVATVTNTLIEIAGTGLMGGVGNQFHLHDAYTIQQTGGATVSGNSAVLSGGTAGIGWIEQSIATTSGQSYRVTFAVSDGPVAGQVGSGSKASDLLAEASYPLGNQAMVFTATSGTSYIQFRNNQDSAVKVGAVSAKIYGIDGWRLEDVGKYVKINDGIVHLTTFTSNTSMTGEIVKELRDAIPAPPAAWSLESPVWSDALGWPSTVMLYEGRLYLGGGAFSPQRPFGSVIDDFFNFGIGSIASDAVEFPIVDAGGNITLNRIQWMMPAENMLVGTTHGEYRLVGSGDDPLSGVTPPRVRIQSTFGSDDVQPLKVGAALIFCQRQGSKLREMVFDERTITNFVAPDMTVLAAHLLATSRIKELAYAPEPLSLIYAVRGDGVLLVNTYDQPEQIKAWTRLTTDGYFESVAVIPHPTENSHQVWCTVIRNGQRAVEYFDPEYAMPLPTPWVDLVTGDVSTAWKGLTLDAATTFTGSALHPVQTLTGLPSYLEGRTVQAVGDGLVFKNLVVGSGQVILPMPVQNAVVGLAYAARGKTLRPEVAVRGSSQGQAQRWVSIDVWVHEAAALTVEGEAVLLRQPSMLTTQGVPPRTTLATVYPQGWSDGSIAFVADEPLPCTVVGLSGVLDLAAEQDTPPPSGGPNG